MLTVSEVTLQYLRHYWIKHFKTFTPLQKNAYTMLIANVRRRVDNEKKTNANR